MTTQLVDPITGELTEAHAEAGAESAPLDEVLAELVAHAPDLLARDQLPKLLTRGIKKRRASAIHGYIGLNGNFKSWAMVRDTLPSIALGRRVLSTVTILDPHTGNPHPQFVPFTSWSQMFEFEHGDILLDEITGIMDSRDQGMPKAVRRLMPQMRRRDVLIRWTGIDWDNSDRRLRQLSQAVTKCRGHLPDWRSVRRANRDQEATAVMWAPNRLAFLTTFDSSSLMASEDTKQLNYELGGQSKIKARRARVLCREMSWAPKSLTFRAYNTLDSVLTVDSSCIHGLDVAKPRPCTDPACVAAHLNGLGRVVPASVIAEVASGR
jgi:hypothetical protein